MSSQDLTGIVTVATPLEGEAVVVEWDQFLIMS